MRRLEQNGGILIRALLISGIVIVMTMIVGTHSVTGSTDPQTITGEGKKAGAADCTGENPIILARILTDWIPPMRPTG